MSRALSRWLIGSDAMLCAEADWHGHWARHVLNAAFLDRGHCKAAADYEARHGRETDAIEDWRHEGWM